MNKDNIIDFCKIQFQIFGMPIRVFKNNTLVTKLDHILLNNKMPVIIDEHIAQKLLTSDKTITYSLEFPMLSYGIVKSKTSDYSIVIGPSRSLSVESTLTNSIIKQYSLTPDAVRTISEYIGLLPIMQIGRFLYVLSSIYTYLNDEIIDINSFYNYQDDYKVDDNVYKEVILHSEKLSYDEIDKLNHYDFEKRILFYIKNGMTHHIKSLWREAFSESPFPINQDTLRLTKDNCIMAIGIITLTALSTGLNAEDVYKLREVYIHQTEMCHSVQEVMKLRFNIMVDFSERIKNMTYRLTDNPIINRVINYIVENAKNKLSLADIAQHVKSNKTYLCSKFKEETGQGIADFINLQKICEAKGQLKFTSKTLVEISTYLSFSSQSYFQKIFKEIAGITPSEFRQQSE